MADLLNEIIEVDKAARKRLENAQNERAVALASIASQRDALIDSEKQKAKKKAEAISQKGKSEGEKQLEKIKERNIEIIRNMDNLYQNKKDEWIDTIVGNILSQ